MMLFLALMVCTGLVYLTGIWWTIVPMAFLVAMTMGRSPKHSFWAAFLANSLAWSLLITYRMIESNTILLAKMSAMFFLPHWSILVLIAIITGGISSGAGGLAGALTKQYIKTRKAK